MAGDLSKSAQHAVEALVLGVKYPAAGFTGPTVWEAVSLTVPTAAAGVYVSAAVTTTITGVHIGDIVLIQPQAALPAGQNGVFATVTATNTVSVFGLGSAAGYTGAAITYNILVFRQS
jgi:hypothetical protein